MNRHQLQVTRLPFCCSRHQFVWFMACILLQSVVVYSQNEKEIRHIDFYTMSIEDLMNVEVTTGTLTEILFSKIPVSLTIITESDIKTTPARNLFDLIEIYVPSATFVNHWLGPRFGMRGVSGDQNSSYLVMVNGIKMNSGYQGQSLTEIQNKDLNDIEKIEIIRGPGSVTYGSGAIGGIINIITKKAGSSDGLKIKAEGNLEYRYGTISLSYGFRSENVKLLLYGSTSLSEGQNDPKFFYIDRAHGYGYGFMSPTWGYKGLGSPAPNFYEDYWDKPEYKLHLDVELFDEFHFWARLTTYNFTKQQQETATADGPDFPGLFGKQFTAILENKHSFTDSLTLSSSLGFSSQSHRDVAFYQGTNKPSSHITQRNYSYSENDLFFKSQVNYNMDEAYRFAIGGEFHYETYGPEWGMKDDTFILGFQAPIRFAVYDTDSEFYQQYGDAFCTVVEEKISANSLSVFFEASMDVTDKQTLLFSGRADKHDFSEWALSPRVAWISEINSKNTIKAIYQQSVRLPSFQDLYSQHMISETASKPEELRGTELIYSRMQNEQFKLVFSGHYQSIDQIAWLSTERSGLIGTFELAGFEAEAIFSTKTLKAGGSYSYIKQMSWEPETIIEAYIDVNLAWGSDNVEKVYFSDYAQNRINNLPVHAFKFYVDHQIIPTLNLHLDCRANFDYQQEDMLYKFKEAHDIYGTQVSQDEMNAIYDSLHDHGYGEHSFTSNVSVNWNISSESIDMELSFYAMNLLSVNHVRYVMQYWEGGNNRQYPRQAGFIEEPVNVGLKLMVQF